MSNEVKLNQKQHNIKYSTIQYTQITSFDDIEKIIETNIIKNKSDEVS